MKVKPHDAVLPPRKEMERAFSSKDESYDGIFYVAVRTTGIFCRPSCPAPRPKPENVEYLPSIRECLFAGYRPCQRCRPLETDGTPPKWVAELISRVESTPDARLRGSDLRSLGVSPERARRWFNRHYGMSFVAWCRGYRLASAFTQIRQGTNLDDVTFGSGFESHSGFRDAFARAFGQAPGRSRRNGSRIVVRLIESPLGPLLVGVGDEGVCFLDYTDRRMLEHNLATIRRRFGCATIPGEHRLLDKLREELAQYFARERREFTVPLMARGTPFQERVWSELRRIPWGETMSYEDLAKRIGKPTAQRAVARANGLNRICILIPCHRVIGKDGSLTGYGGGLWRKRLLLELEKSRG